MIFKNLENPDNAEEPKDEVPQNDIKHFVQKSIIRIHLEKKGRGGKAVSIIRGLKMTNTLMKKIEKELKAQCGVGGSQKNGEIIIQGDKREKILEYFKKLGARDVKKSGG